MKILLKCDQRLGDIILCEPIARHFADGGHWVFFQTLPEYRQLFDRIEAATWIGPTGAAMIEFGEVHELSIWPDSYDDYRASGAHYVDYLYRNFPQVINRTPDLIANHIDAPSEVVAPFGISGGMPWTAGEVIQAAGFDRNAVVLWDGSNYQGPPPIYRPNMVCPNLGNLIDVIASCTQFATVNTATSIIASAVRSSYTHINLTGEHGKQDNYTHPTQKRITLNEPPPAN